MTTELPSGYTFGKVVGQAIRAVGDQPEDTDYFPEAQPIVGKKCVVFTPKVPQVVTPDNGVATMVMQDKIDCDMNAQGQLIRNSDDTGDLGVWLYTGVWTVSFNGVMTGIPSFDILVTEFHAEDPLDLFANMATPIPPSDPITTLVIPSGGGADMVLSWVDGRLQWVNLSYLTDVPLQDAAISSIAKDPSTKTHKVIDLVASSSGSQAAAQAIAANPDVITQAAAFAQTDAGLVRGVPGTAPLAVGGVVDASGNVTELVFDRDGQVPKNILMAWASRIGGLGRSVLPITCWGDSQTGNDDSSALMWTKVMATDLGVAVTNRGFPGETSSGIAAKSGAIPAVWRSGGTIPASGSVDVVLADHVKVMLWWHPMKCSIAGVHGVLSRSPNISGGTPSEDYPAIFTRDTPGGAVAVPAYAPFIPDDVSLRGNMTIIMAGRNNTGNPARALSDTAAMIDFLTGTDRKWAVLSQITGAGRDAINDGLKAAYGRHYWNMLPYLVSTQALSDAGITPTQADLDAIAAGNIPPSFTSDGVHLNNAGLTVQGAWVTQKVTGALWLQ